jgi:hypothetical protein
LPRAHAVRNPIVMADTATDRIERALARIEAAAAARAWSVERLAHRHTALREKIEDAVASLDALIAREKMDAD